LDAIAGDARAVKYFQYANHIFEEKDREYALQAADLRAWTVAKASAISGGTVPNSVKPFVEQLVRCDECLDDRSHLSDFTGERLKAYMMEQAHVPAGYIPVDFGRGRPTLK
jgi:hypothetical protein